MLKQIISSHLPSCCNVAFLNISDCSSEEQFLINELFPGTNTIIVLVHHIKTSLEWSWFPLESERGNTTCGADLHVKNIIAEISTTLKDKGFSTYIIPYPGRCGIRMKDFANKTNLGEMGDNYLFLHKEWGPWVHLRTILTDAVITSDFDSTIDVCIHCGNCISSCPAKAIGVESFNGVGCGGYQASIWNGIPDNYYWKCEECARVCPIGNVPISIKIIHEDK